MFKLPLLQPHLTGTQNGTDGGGKTSGTATPTKIGYGSFLSHTWPLKEPSTGLDFNGGSAEVKDWEAQGRDITSEVTCSEKYKSLALHAEVKLAEALERCTRLCPDAYNSEGEGKPNKLKTAVCSQLLGEFAELCGPFGSALKTIRDELVQSIYSPLYASDRGLLVFDQIPWFKVAERLESEKEMMLEERRRFQEMLNQQQAMIGRIEEQVGIYQHATASAQQELLFLRGRVEALSKSEESARLEAKTGREELKRARKEWLKMKDDLDGERDAHKQTKAQADHDISALQQHMRVLNGLVQQAEKTAQEAQHSLAGWVPPDEVEEIQAKAMQLGKELSSTKSKLLRAEEKLKAQAEAMGTMTPRPSWKALHVYGIHESKGKGTQALVAAAAQKLASQAESLQSACEHAQLVQAVNLPEPMPREIQLAVTTDASAYFITEEPSASPSKVQVEGLGLGPNVPRCLRWTAGELIEVPVLGQQEAEVMVMQVLEAKRIYDAHHMPEHLQSFLYIYLSTQCSKLGSSPAASPAPSNATSISRDSSGRPSSGLRSSGTQRPPSGSSGQSSPHGSGAAHSGSGASLMQQPKGMRGTVRSTSLSLKASAGRESKGPSPPAQADHAEVVKHAYGLYHALRSHSAVSPILRLFWRVLSGALPEEAISQQRLLFGAVAHAARRIAYAHATMVAHQRGAAPAATNPGSNNNDKMNAMARETEAEADEHMEGAADQLASSTAKARKGKRGQRGGRLRTASPGGDPDKGEEEEEEAGEREKSAEAAPQVAIDPCDLIVSTEHMQGALQALLPGRSASELQVLLDAYSSCVASLSQQQQQQSMITVHEGSSSPDSMPSGACSLPHLEGLLQPLVLGCSTKAIAVQASTTAAGNTDWQGSRDDASRERKVQAFTGRAVGTTLSDGFVSMLLEELVDELEEASSNLTAAIFAATTAAASSPAAESGSGGRNESIAGSRGPSRASSPTLPLLPPALEPSAAPDQAIPARTSAPSPTEPAPRQTSSAFLLLGQKVPAAALVEAMVGVGLAPSDAARVVTGTLGCGTPGGASLGETLVAAWRHGMLDGVPVWSNLAAAAARATMLLQRPGMHDVQGMLTWVERLCSNMISPAGRQEDAEGGNEGEGVGQERGKDEDKAV